MNNGMNNFNNQIVKEPEKSKKKTIIIIVSIIGGIILLIAAGIIAWNKYVDYMFNKADEEIYNSIDDIINEDIDIEDNDDYYEEEIEDDDLKENIKLSNGEIYNIELEKSYYSLTIDGHLNIEMQGEEDPNFEDGYKYTLKITFDGKPVSPQTLFENTNDKVVYSKNYAASFSIEKTNNVYILASEIAKQSNGSYVSVINSKGTVLNNFYDVSMRIDNYNNQLTITKCQDNSVDATCPTTIYQIVDDNLIMK